jgi:hypothetical protein
MTEEDSESAKGTMASSIRGGMFFIYCINYFGQKKKISSIVLLQDKHWKFRRMVVFLGRS